MSRRINFKNNICQCKNEKKRLKAGDTRENSSKDQPKVKSF